MKWAWLPHRHTGSPIFTEPLEKRLDRCKESELSCAHSAPEGLLPGQPTHHRLHETALNAKGTRRSLPLLGLAHMFYRLCCVRGKGSGHHQMQSVMLLGFPPPPSFAFSPHSLPLPRQLRHSVCKEYSLLYQILLHQSEGSNPTGG